MSSPTQQKAADDKNKQKATDDQAKAAQSVSAYRATIAFVVLALLLFLISKFRVGYTLLYYLAALALFFLIVTQYQSITTLLAPINSLNGGNPNG